MASKDTDTLIKAIHEQTKGAIRVISGGKHKKLIYTKDSGGNRKGQAVRDESGPLILSDTPGEHRNRELAVHRLIKAGVLKFDPWKGPPPKQGRERPDRNPEEAFEQKQARRLAVADASNKAHAATQSLRERVEPMVARLGGWEKRGFRSELGAAAYSFLGHINFVPKWPSKDAAIMSAHTLAKGNTLSGPSNEMWSRFFQELETSHTPRERYFELVRASKGVAGVHERERLLAQRVGSDGTVERTVEPGSGTGTTLDARSNGARDEPFEFISLARLHERSGLKWSMGLTIDEYAELQRAYGFMEAVILRDYGDRGAAALETISKFLIKMGEARFYSMAERPEVDELV